MQAMTMASRASARCALLCAALLMAGCGSDANRTIAPPGPSVGQQADATMPSAVTNAALTSSSGQRFTLASLAGKVVVLSDIMTLCQETCPLDTANVVDAARAAQKAGLGNRIAFVSLTIDPARDTTAQLAAYRRQFTPAPADWTVATGSPATLSTLWHRLGVYIQRVPDTPPAPRNWRTGQRLTYDLTHSDEVFFIDAHRSERFLLEGAPHLAAGTSIPPALARFMDATGRRNITHPDPLAWTLPQELDVLSWLTQHQIVPPSSG
jgi:protein SCO1/2